MTIDTTTLILEFLDEVDHLEARARHLRTLLTGEKRHEPPQPATAWNSLSPATQEAYVDNSRQYAAQLAARLAEAMAGECHQ